MDDIVKTDITDWYGTLVTDIKAIIVERIYRARQEVITCWWEVGERIVTDPNYQKYSRGNQSAAHQLAVDIGCSLSSLYFAIKFYDKFPNILTLETLPEGKNLSWHKIVNTYLTDKPEPVTTNEIIDVKPVIDMTPYHDLMQGCMVAYNHYAKRPPWLEHMGQALLQMDDEPFDGCQSFISSLRELVAELERMLSGK